jgi:predicted RNase H-like nuclease (RuvC/YqgF family)
MLCTGQLVKQTNDAATIQRLEEENQNLRNAHAEATTSLRSRKDQQATIERLQKQSKEANDKIKELQRSLKTYEPLPSQFTQTPPLSS